MTCAILEVMLLSRSLGLLHLEFLHRTYSVAQDLAATAGATANKLFERHLLLVVVVNSGTKLHTVLLGTLLK
jgi:hypothetical protein